MTVGAGAGAGAPAGRVTIVGGGPGDPGLITVTGLERLRAADVVITDRLAPTALLDGLGPGVEIIRAGKGPGVHERSQDEINAALIEHALAGKHVVRLKGGDPYVFGRGMEEVLACEAAGIEVEVVPGVSSAVAVPALAGIPVTHRGVAQGFVVVSGHVPPGDPGSDVDWEALARSGCTIVVLMGTRHLEAIASSLVLGGRPAATPVACICEGFGPGERVVRSTLRTVVADARAQGVTHPAVIVVGEVAGELSVAPPARTNRRVLVLGGARSGKSAYAESRLSQYGAVEYVATSTADPHDLEWVARVEAHRRRRPSAWVTTETTGVPHVVPWSLSTGEAGVPVLIDSITGWLAGVLDRRGAWDDRTGWIERVDADARALVAAWASTARHVVAVSDEVGGGVVPDSAAGRLFRDELGRLNQRLAAAADEVWLVTAGIPRRLT